MNPIPCMNCGINFMRQDINPEAPRLCNNCKKPKVKNMSDIQIIIECDRQTQIEIEEICINKGINFSQYFIDLHKNHKFCSKNSDPEVTTSVVESAPDFKKSESDKIQSPQDFGKKFESLSHKNKGNRR